MIVMINGAFGSGKTTAATRLHSLLPNSMIYDPEEVGYMLRNIVVKEVRTKEEQTGDFQDLELWRILTVNVAKELKQKYNKHLIIPMTIYKASYFDYIRNGLKKVDSDLHHFCLVASEETIHQRLIERGETAGSWPFQQTRKCVEAFNDSRFEEHIQTDQMDSKQVVDLILSKVAD